MWVHVADTGFAFSLCLGAVTQNSPRDPTCGTQSPAGLQEEHTHGWFYISCGSFCNGQMSLGQTWCEVFSEFS